ncbi:MAG TPA: divergent PAP2 family protein [Bacilli bacterium]|nr:divergent PAP2 family protein [Bacilli bacterium]
MYFKYRFILVPITALIICQIIKFTLESIKCKELRFDRLLNGAGGMPSTHTTFSISLTTLVGLEIGASDPLFAVCLIFSMIVSYDAIGVRYESGKQAEAINDLVEDLITNKKQKLNYKVLKEQLGHKPLEVLGGLILGFTVSFIFYTFIF